MGKKYPSERAERFQIRLPDGLRDDLRSSAKANGRSMNAEIVARLVGGDGTAEVDRDWFAGQALTGIVAGLCSNSARGDRAYDRVGFSDAAEDAYTLADAMIAARKGGAA